MRYTAFPVSHRSIPLQVGDSANLRNRNMPTSPSAEGLDVREHHKQGEELQLVHAYPHGSCETARTRASRQTLTAHASTYSPSHTAKGSLCRRRVPKHRQRVGGIDGSELLCAQVCPRERGDGRKQSEESSEELSRDLCQSFRMRADAIELGEASLLDYLQCCILL